MIRSFAAAALAAAQPLLVPVPAPPCVTRAEVGDAVITVVPIVLETMIQRCRPYLADTAFLNVGGPGMAARLNAAAAPRRASALRALGANTRINGQLMASGEEALARITAMISDGFAGTGARSCADVDTLFESLEPLPPENIARIVGAIMALALNRAPAQARHMICEP